MCLTSFPCFSIDIRCPQRAASPILWVMTTRPMPSLAFATSVSMKLARFSGGRMAVGSSRMRKDGLVYKAQSSAVRKRSAGLSVLTVALKSTRQFHRVARSSTYGRIFLRWTRIPRHPRAIFSRTVRSSARSGRWWTMAIPRSSASAGESNATSRESRSILPDVGVSSPDRM